jgi:hypothetical protein
MSMRRRTAKESAALSQPKTTTDEDKALLAADLIGDIAGNPDAMRQLWDAINEPARETMLSYFAEWDIKFCDALNPAV